MSEDHKKITIDISFVRKYAEEAGINYSEAMHQIGEQLIRLSEKVSDDSDNKRITMRWYSAICEGRWNTGDRHTWSSREHDSSAEALIDWSAHVAQQPDATHSLRISEMVDGP